MATAYIIMGSSVTILKNTSKVARPDGSDTKSFPSGHTATAFMGAEFLYQEYKDVSVW
jgi:membrane-associated phospholipid phosphatase